jgi:hypothetical protein
MKQEISPKILDVHPKRFLVLITIFAFIWILFALDSYLIFQKGANKIYFPIADPLKYFLLNSSNVTYVPKA